MGLLVDGKWQDQWYDTKKSNGKFVRQDSMFRHQISSEQGSEFTPQTGRYHLYVSLACPWAHRTLIFRKLKQLEDHITVSVVSPDMLAEGWEFAQYEGATQDHLYDFDFMHQVYTKDSPKITSRVTVPVLWDKKLQKIVNNESSDIIRILNSAFNELTGNKADYYPSALKNEIDKINDFIYPNINNGVYKTGFATTQNAYEDALQSLFSALDLLEESLTSQRYLVGDTLTEADWRLFTTLIRFDPVYVGHFKCNLKRIEDYPALSAYLRDLYQTKGVAETVNFDHIKRHYYFSHTMINPTQVVPNGPIMNLDAVHNRESLS
jgi:putative glutathione S-transferase